MFNVEDIYKKSSCLIKYMTENFIQSFMMLTTFISLDLKKFKITLKYLKKYLSCCYSYLFNGLVTIRNPPIIKCNQLQKYSFHFFFLSVITQINLVFEHNNLLRHCCLHYHIIFLM